MYFICNLSKHAYMTLTLFWQKGSDDSHCEFEVLSRLKFTPNDWMISHNFKFTVVWHCNHILTYTNCTISFNYMIAKFVLKNIFICYTLWNILENQLNILNAIVYIWLKDKYAILICNTSDKLWSHRKCCPKLF